LPQIQFYTAQDVLLVLHRVMSAYISKGTRLTIHSNSIGHRSENNITVYSIFILTKFELQT